MHLSSKQPLLTHCSATLCLSTDMLSFVKGGFTFGESFGTKRVNEVAGWLGGHRGNEQNGFPSRVFGEGR